MDNDLRIKYGGSQPLTDESTYEESVPAKRICPYCLGSGHDEKKPDYIGENFKYSQEKVLTLIGKGYNVDRLIKLTPTEKLVFDCLLANKGHFVSREHLTSYIWNNNGGDWKSRVADVYIGYLRKKLGQNSIITVRGVGYKLNLE